MQRFLSDLKAHPLAWAFLNPVNADEVPDYYGVIKRPMGLYQILCHIFCINISIRFQHDGTQIGHKSVLLTEILS